MSSFKTFKIDARVILNLGRHSIKDYTTALVELVKNSYDADASTVDIEIYIAGEESYIRVADNGIGMSEDELNNNWLRIGFSEKTNNKFSSSKNRRKTGEKGIGRISADRLGANVQVVSRIDGNNASSLTVNWDDFDVEGKDVNDINILFNKDAEINIPPHSSGNSNSGTELIIKNLRQDWTRANIENLYEDLSVLTPPFQSINDFSININTNIEHSFPSKVNSAFFLSSEIEINLEFDGRSEELIFLIKDKYSPKTEKIELIKWKNLVLLEGKGLSESVSDYPRCGPASLKLWFYPRKSTTVKGTEFSLASLREFLDNNSGVKIYRDGVAVKPYGFKFGQTDWLGLAERKADDPAGISRETYKITPNQLVGAIFISRDENQKLIDSAAREGLVESDSLTDLKLLTLGAINILETHRYNLNKKGLLEVKEQSSEKKELKSSLNTIKKLRNDLALVKNNLDSIEPQIPKQLASPLRRSIENVDKIIDETEKSFEAILSENRVLSGLATLGIASAVFGHETQSALSVFNNAIKNVKNLLLDKIIDHELIDREATKALKYSKQISSWGSFALTRVQNEKRKLNTRNIKNLIEGTLSEMKNSLEASKITLDIEAEQVMSKTYPMDIESIIVNLVTNAFTACLNNSRKRQIRVKLFREDMGGTSGYTIQVADSGPGIHADFIDRIWEPLFSTRSNNSSKKVGTGLGLTIVKSTVDELEGNVSVTHDPILKGACFNIWIPKI